MKNFVFIILIIIWGCNKTKIPEKEIRGVSVASIDSNAPGTIQYPDTNLKLSFDYRFKNCLKEYTRIEGYKGYTIDELIADKKGYISLLDKPKLPSQIQFYYYMLKEYIIENEMEFDKYYLDTNGIRAESNLLLIPLHHLDGFVADKKLEEKNRELNKNGKGNLILIRTGGGGGTIEIDIYEQRIVGFFMWC